LEGDGFFSPAANFPVFLSAASGKTVSVTAKITSGSAGACSTCGSRGCDFINQTTVITFLPGTTSKLFTVQICGDLLSESTETYVATLSSPVNAALGSAFQATGSIRDNDGVFIGTFDLSPIEGSVAALDRLTYAFSWTVPEPENWHDLRDLQFRIRDGDDIILWIGFNEADRTFSVYNQAAKSFSDAKAAGSNERLETAWAVLELARSSVVASGPTSPTVTLNLALSFKPRATGRTFLVEVAASDDLGHEEEFKEAGTLTVTPVKGRD
jgi:hypothetical protein